MAQLQHMDAHLDTFSDELWQVTTHVDHIVRQQARLGGFTASPSPSLESFKDEHVADGDNDDDENDKDARSSSDVEMTASQ